MPAPIPWSPGTAGVVTGPAVRFDLHSHADLKRFAGKLKNAFLLMDEPLQPTGPRFEADAKRSSDARLAELAATQPQRDMVNELEHERFTDRFLNDPASVAWLAKEDVAAVLFVAPGDYGTIVQAGNGDVSLDQTNQTIPLLKVSAESYGRIARLLEKKLPVTLELEMRNRVTGVAGLTNVIVEMPGTDPRLKDEVVMVGAHIDSWAFGTGATDNACNVATIMEALRILQALDLKPRRTIRAGFWTHEEQGAKGSGSYVDQHFVSGPTAAFEKEKFSVYFNMDMGAGKIRGLVRVPTADAKAIFEAWMKPYNELGAKTVSPWDIGGGDDGWFIRAGLPSFGFLQDPLDYNTRTHHTSSDVYERIPPDDARFNSVFVAHFLWCAAQREVKFPR